MNIRAFNEYIIGELYLTGLKVTEVLAAKEPPTVFVPASYWKFLIEYANGKMTEDAACVYFESTMGKVKIVRMKSPYEERAP